MLEHNIKARIGFQEVYEQFKLLKGNNKVIINEEVYA